MTEIRRWIARFAAFAILGCRDLPGSIDRTIDRADRALQVKGMHRFRAVQNGPSACHPVGDHRRVPANQSDPPDSPILAGSSARSSDVDEIAGFPIDQDEPNPPQTGDEQSTIGESAEGRSRRETRALNGIRVQSRVRRRELEGDDKCRGRGRGGGPSHKDPPGDAGGNGPTPRGHSPFSH